MNGMNLVLASKSPRRIELLRAAGLLFSIRPADIDERTVSVPSPCALAKVLAQQKARAAFLDASETVIGCDTVVAVGNEALGKPKDYDDAVRILTMLSGRRHSVFTGVCIKTAQEEKTFVCETGVWFYPLSEEEIASYAKTDEPYDKAGAYGIQGKGGLFVEKIEGDYNNVVGLPVSRLVRVLGSYENEKTRKKSENSQFNG